jgi:transcriptional regulator with XRE-family HTH domain
MTPASTRPVARERRGRVTVWTVNVDAIERARILRGWTLVDLSRAAHVDRGTLSDVIHEARQPTLGTVRAIATALGLTMADTIAFPESRCSR